MGLGTHPRGSARPGTPPRAPAAPAAHPLTRLPSRPSLPHTPPTPRPPLFPSPSVPPRVRPLQFTDVRTKDLKWFQQEFTKLELELITTEDRADGLERELAAARDEAQDAKDAQEDLQAQCEHMRTRCAEPREGGGAGGREMRVERQRLVGAAR